MTFIPKGADTKTGKRGRDFYTRIRDVTDRILEKRNQVETKIAQDYLDEMMLLDEDSEYEVMPQPPRRILSPRRVSRLDLSWKEAGSTFPRSSSRVGYEFQAVDLPLAGSFDSSQDGTLANPQSAQKIL